MLRHLLIFVPAFLGGAAFVAAIWRSSEAKRARNERRISV